MEISERVSAGPLHPSLTSASASPAANQQPFTFNNFLKLTPLSRPPPLPGPWRTYGDQVIFAGASNKCIQRRYERGRREDV